jgi:ComF family protein
VKCGRELSGALAEAECLDCRKRRFHYGELRVLGTWDTKLRSLVHGLKFEQRHSVAAVLADSLAGFIDPAFFLVDCMVPVPLHGKRLKERGYNQSLLILERLGRRLGVPVLPDGLRRTRNTRPQSQLSREERLENVRDAFGPGRQAGLLAGKRVLLFDDVMTTGNTLNEASRILAKCGPASVRLLVVARAE